MIVADVVNITWGGNDSDGDVITNYFVVVNGSTQCDTGGTTDLNCTFTPTADGFHVFNVTAFDGTDNGTVSTSNFSFTNLAPNISFHDPTPGDGEVEVFNIVTINVSVNVSSRYHLNDLSLEQTMQFSSIQSLTSRAKTKNQ